MNSLIVNKLTSNIDEKLRGIDLSKTLNNNDIDIIYGSLINNKVIFFRDQIIHSKSHMNFQKILEKLIRMIKGKKIYNNFSFIDLFKHTYAK